MQRKFYQLPAINEECINNNDYFFLFETSLFDKNNFLSYIFLSPIDIIKINRSKDVLPAFEKIEQYSKKYYLAGYFSYELGLWFENLGYRATYPYPLIHLCVFEKAICFNHATGRTNRDVRGVFTKKKNPDNFTIKNLKLSFREDEYSNKINRIKEFIKNGDTYQVNFTGKYRFKLSGLPFSLYQDLKNKQNVSYGAFCKFKEEHVISLSPELFFKRKGRILYSKPMKGTIERGRNIDEDKRMASQLKDSIKNAAENLMIVDLVRNDLGRISEVGSVKALRLFDIEKYGNLFQMTSTIKGILRKGITYFDIFKSIFPGGSVTGAPKIRTMQIIKELEREPRHIYCGALGIIFPKKKSIFNLPIRTLSLVNKKGEMGVGSGIVYDSCPREEFKECLLKAKFLTERYRPFQLLETILWNGKKYKFLDEHLKRMQGSAQYFNFSFSRPKITSSLKITARKFNTQCLYKTRLLLGKEGKVKIEYSRIHNERSHQDARVILSAYRTDPNNVFCFHKTTNRVLYDLEYKHYSSLGYTDVLFLNNRNEVSEGAVSNLIIKKANKYYTPPITSGLLPGIFRNFMIKKHKVKEKVISLEDLLKADKIFVCNSVRGLTEVSLKI